MPAPQHSPTRAAAPGRPGTDRRFALTPAQYRRVTGFALAFIAAIVVTGAAVRLTESGLGCETWPNCSSDALIEFGSPNQTIEQVNRLFTGLVSLSVIAAVLGSLWRVPRRADLTRWSWTLVAGVLGQIVLGGITVLVDLHPVAVGAHFVLSMILVACAVVLHHRAGEEAGPRVRRVAPPAVGLAWVATFGAWALMLTGPAVTGSGPHAGDARAQRFGFSIPDVARVHSINMWIFLVSVVALIFVLIRTRAPREVLRRAQLLLAVIVAQGAIGYAQYELGIPAWLVLAHIAGATAVLGATTWLLVSTSAPRDAEAVSP